jgi:acyl-CoA thioester hydrolase
MPCEFQATRRVEFSDTDMEGIMHFSNFFRFMETAEHAFFRSLGQSVVLSRNGLALCLPRVHAECDYLAPLHFEDEVLVHLLVEKKGTCSLTYRFRFHRLNGPRRNEVARGRLTVVSAARSKDGSLKAVRLPREIASKIQPAPPHMLAAEGPSARRKLDVRQQSAGSPRRRPGIAHRSRRRQKEADRASNLLHPVPRITPSVL